MTILTKERVRKLLDYDPQSGMLTWKATRRGRFGNPGDEAGSIDHKGHVRVGIDRKVYSAARIIHLWMTGALPKSRMVFKDRDIQNLRWSNLADGMAGYSVKLAARRAREHRAVRQTAIQIIQADTQLLRAYNMSAEDSRSVMRVICKQVRAERRHHMQDLDGEDAILAAAAGEPREEGSDD